MSYPSAEMQLEYSAAQYDWALNAWKCSHKEIYIQQLHQFIINSNDSTFLLLMIIQDPEAVYLAKVNSKHGSYVHTL